MSVSVRAARSWIRGHRRLAAALVLFALLVLVDLLWLETRVLLWREDVRLGLAAPPLTLVHLSDLHVSEETPLLRRLLRQVAAARPAAIVISGDMIRDDPRPAPLARHTAYLARFLGELRRIAPVYAVQGHSEYQGPVAVGLVRSGLTWLSNEGRWIAPGVLLLGLDQQVGEDAFVPNRPNPFRLLQRGGRTFYGATTGAFRNFYSHYDPAPASLADAGGPLAWSGYDLLCDVWIDAGDVGAGIAVHSRHVLGEDRMIRLRRVRAEHGNPGSFYLVAHGTVLTGDLDTGVDPEPERWYRLRLRTRVEPGRVTVAARAWPADEPEPGTWQAQAEDRSPQRIESGTVGLWAWGGGTVLYRDLRVEAPDGRLLLARTLAGPAGIAGLREGARGTRLAMALARSPAAPPGTVRLALSHTTDPAPEAAYRGLDALLAGHTHGGQVRLPLHGAVITRSKLGAHYDLGLYAFAAPNPRGWTWLYVNPGIGTSLLPIRFWCPPRWTVVEVSR